MNQRGAIVLLHGNQVIINYFMLFQYITTIQSQDDSVSKKGIERIYKEKEGERDIG